MFSWSGELQILHMGEHDNQADVAETEDVLVMHDDTIRRLPHRIIHVESISATADGELKYCFKLGHSNKEIPNKIQMDKLAQQFDCFSILYDDADGKFRWGQLVRAVFRACLKIEKVPDF